MKEMHSDPQENATGQGGTHHEGAELDPKALAAIRDLLVSETATEAEVPTPELPDPAPVRHTNTAGLARLPDIAPAPVSPQRATAKRTAKRKPAKRPTKGPGLFRRMISSCVGYRPSAKVVLWAGFALLLFLRPVLVIGLSLLAALVMIGVFLVVGYDRFWRGAMRAARWYASRHPDRAAAMHEKLDAFALKWDAVLDRFPEGSVDGLYLPDFDSMVTADARHDATMERRFADMAENEG